MSNKEYNCAICFQPAPSGKCKHIRGVPVGPVCYQRLKRRERIRAGGSNMRMVLNDETNLAHAVSSNADVCPSDQTHCLDCPFRTAKQCPVEVKYGKEFFQNGH
jgi:hypothetical protein